MSEGRVSIARCAAIAAVAVLAGVPTGASAGPPKPEDQTSTSIGATWAEARAYEGGICIPSADGWSYNYRADFVDPGTVVSGDGPTRPGEADLRKPWVSFVIERFRPPLRKDCVGPLREFSVLCGPFLNTEEFEFFANPVTRAARLSVDVRCDDGRGYDFYRVTWETAGRDTTGACWDEAVRVYCDTTSRVMDDAWTRLSSGAVWGGWGWGSWEPGEWGGGIYDTKSGATRGLGPPKICRHSPVSGMDCFKNSHIGHTAAYNLDSLTTWAQVGD